MSMYIGEALGTEVGADLLLCKLWSLSELERLSSLEEVLAMPTSSKPTLERNIVDVYSKGSRADWVKRLYPTLIPAGMAIAQVADYLGIAVTALSRAKNHGTLTLEQLTRLSQLMPNGTSLPLPPPGAGFLSGMARAVPWTQNIIDHQRDPHSRTYRAQDDLSYQQVEYLKALINDEANLRCWLLGITEAGDDRRALARNPRIQPVLASCLSAASASLKSKLIDEAPFAFDLGSPQQSDRFCNHIVNLWNRMQAGWVVANEAIRGRIR